MVAQLIDGKQLAAKIRGEITAEIAAQTQAGHRPPGLAVILVGDDPASSIYVKNKRQACEEVGIKSFHHALAETITEEDLLNLIADLNKNPEVDGILLQLPLPKHIHSEKMLEAIAPSKDVDGFHPFNLGRLAQRRPLLRPCTPYGIMTLLDSIDQVYKNRLAVIVGASNIVGRPMALELLIAGCTVTICHRFTQNLKDYVAQADILISAAGKPGLIKGDWVKSGSTVIDVGINRLKDGTITGDIEFEEAKKTRCLDYTCARGCRTHDNHSIVKKYFKCKSWTRKLQ